MTIKQMVTVKQIGLRIIKCDILVKSDDFEFECNEEDDDVLKMIEEVRNEIDELGDDED